MLDYSLFQTYYDLFLSSEARDDMSRYGVSAANMRKLRTAAGDKVTSDAKEVAMAPLHGTKYCIALDHPILLSHGVFYPRGLSHPLKFEITLAPVSDIVVYSDTTKLPSYKITNLELEHLANISRTDRWRTTELDTRVSMRMSCVKRLSQSTRQPTA